MCEKFTSIECKKCIQVLVTVVSRAHLTPALLIMLTSMIHCIGVAFINV